MDKELRLLTKHSSDINEYTYVAYGKIPEDLYKNFFTRIEKFIGKTMMWITFPSISIYVDDLEGYRISSRFTVLENGE